MGESQARKRSREAKAEAAPAVVEPSGPLQITLLGHEIQLSWADLTIGEKVTLRRYVSELGEDADATDGMFCIAAVLLQRADPSLTWEHLKASVTSRMMLDAVKAGKTAEADHPQ